MPEVTVNYLAVLVCVAISMFLGYVWYSAPVFGRAWMNLIGKTEADLKKGAGSAMGFAVVLAFLTSYIMSHIIDFAKAETISRGLTTGFWVWLGFVFTTVAMQNVFAQRPMKLTVINAGYHLVQFLIIGAILAAWQ